MRSLRTSGACRMRAQPIRARPTSSGGVVGAHHAAAAGERERLHDAREGDDARASVRGSVGERPRHEPRHRQSGGSQPFARRAACCARRPPLRGGCPGRPSASTTRAAMTVGRSPTASTPSMGSGRGRLENRRDRCRPRRETGSGSPGPATDPRARRSDRSRRPDRRRDVPPHRRTPASGSRSSSPEAGHGASEQVKLLRIRFRAAVPGLARGTARKPCVRPPRAPPAPGGRARRGRAPAG